MVSLGSVDWGKGLVTLVCSLASWAALTGAGLRPCEFFRCSEASDLMDYGAFGLKIDGLLVPYTTLARCVRRAKASEQLAQALHIDFIAHRKRVQLAELCAHRRELTSRALNTSNPTHMLAWSDLPSWTQNLAIVVGVIVIGIAADVLVPRAGAIKRDDAHANYVAGRDYTKKLRSKKDE